MAQPAYALPNTDTGRWPAQGRWTWEDYLRLPDDGNRYEILEGVLYVSPAPIYDHQFLVFALAGELRSFVSARGLGVILGAPFDVRLPGIANPVQPDVLFFRSGNEPQAGDKYFEGVPDLVVEVLSPGTGRLDRRVKLAAYQKAGVPEYWLADPKTRTVTVYTLNTESGGYQSPAHFGPEDDVRSTILEDFTAPVAPLFPPLKRLGVTSDGE
jgi:Uma2 family endonuclease